MEDLIYMLPFKPAFLRPLLTTPKVAPLTADWFPQALAASLRLLSVSGETLAHHVSLLRSRLPHGGAPEETVLWPRLPSVRAPAPLGAAAEEPPGRRGRARAGKVLDSRVHTLRTTGDRASQRTLRVSAVATATWGNGDCRK